MLKIATWKMAFKKNLRLAMWSQTEEIWNGGGLLSAKDTKGSAAVLTASVAKQRIGPYYAPLFNRSLVFGIETVQRGSG
jgi:hypothetical protein